MREFDPLVLSIQVGDRLGSYEVLAPLGAGGMGEVFRARDSRLQRDVALKVLPVGVALDADRLARFRREAQLLAALNHPNIAAIYGFEEWGDVHALVLELVEGPTLADRITTGALPISEALGIARQIAEALESAHEQGIIHRDLKPANVKVRSDATVKVLDLAWRTTASRPTWGLVAWAMSTRQPTRSWRPRPLRYCSIGRPHLDWSARRYYHAFRIDWSRDATSSTSADCFQSDVEQCLPVWTV